MSKKPTAKLIGENGNIYNLLGIAKRALEKEGMKDEARVMIERAFASKSYEEALNVISEYVEVE